MKVGPQPLVAGETSLSGANDALASRTQRIELALRAAHIVLWEWDITADVVQWPDSSDVRVGNFEPPRNIEAFKALVHPDDLPLVSESLEAALRGPANFAAEFRFLRRDGSVRWTSTRAAVIRDDAGAPRRLVACDQDISAEHGLIEREQAALLKLSNELQAEHTLLTEAKTRIAQGERLKLIGQFAGNLIHDINNVLQGLTGALYLLRRRSPEPSQVKIIEQMERTVERGGKFARQLLDLSRNDGQAAERLDLRKVIAGDLDLYQQLVGTRIALSTEWDQDLWPVHAAPSVLQAVILNLIANARDAQPTGGDIRLRLRNCHANARPPGLPPQDYVAITVADKGVGMAPDVLARVGEAFFTTKAKGTGTGLGLATAREFARSQGGDMIVESAPGHGASVSLFIRRTPLSDDYSTPDIRLHGDADILVAEDDEGLRQHIVARSRRLGYRVIEAEDAAVAEALARQNGRLDIAILGLKVGDRSGVQLANELRERRPRLPVVFLMGAIPVKAPPGELVFRRPVSDAMLAQALLEKLGRAAPSVITPEALRLSDRIRERLRDSSVRAVFDIWRAAAHRTGRVPAVDLVAPMRACVEPDAFLVRASSTGTSEFDYVFLGNALVRRLGRDLTGERLAVREDEALGSLSSAYERCARGVAYFDYARFVLGEGQILLFERLCLPLSADGRSVDHIFGVARFEELALTQRDGISDVGNP